VGGLIRRYPLISYFVIAYAGTWLVWALFVLSREGSGLLPFHSPSSFLVMIGIGTFSGPTVSAFVVTAVTEGREGVVRLLWADRAVARRPCLVRVHVRRPSGDRNARHDRDPGGPGVVHAD
jgi:hypothetical protein